MRAGRTQSKGIWGLDLHLARALANGDLVGATHGAAVDAYAMGSAPVLCQLPWEHHSLWTVEPA